MNWIILIVVGAIAGWLAGYIATRNTRLDIMDVILGIIGAYVGNLSTLRSLVWALAFALNIAILLLGWR